MSVLVGLLLLERWLVLWVQNLCPVCPQLLHFCMKRYALEPILYSGVYFIFILLNGVSVLRLLLAEDGHLLRLLLVLEALQKLWVLQWNDIFVVDC